MPALDISGNGKEEEDGTFTFTLTVKGFKKVEHIRNFGLALEPHVHESIAKAAPGEKGLIRPGPPPFVNGH